MERLKFLHFPPFLCKIKFIFLYSEESKCDLLEVLILLLSNKIRKIIYPDRDKDTQPDVSHTARMIRTGSSCMVYDASRHFQQYFSYIVAVSFIGGGNRRT